MRSRHLAAVLLIFAMACSAGDGSDEDSPAEAGTEPPESGTTSVPRTTATEGPGANTSTTEIIDLVEVLSGAPQATMTELDPLLGSGGLVTDEGTFEPVGEVDPRQDSLVAAQVILIDDETSVIVYLVVPGVDVGAVRLVGQAGDTSVGCIDLRIGDLPIPGEVPGPLPLDMDPRDPVALFAMAGPEIDAMLLTLYQTDPAAGTYTRWQYGPQPIDALPLLSVDGAEMGTLLDAFAVGQSSGCSTRFISTPGNSFTRTP